MASSIQTQRPFSAARPMEIQGQNCSAGSRCSQFHRRLRHRRLRSRPWPAVYREVEWPSS